MLWTFRQLENFAAYFMIWLVSHSTVQLVIDCSFDRLHFRGIKYVWSVISTLVIKTERVVVKWLRCWTLDIGQSGLWILLVSISIVRDTHEDRQSKVNNGKPPYYNSKPLLSAHLIMCWWREICVIIVGLFKKERGKTRKISVLGRWEADVNRVNSNPDVYPFYC